MQRQITTACLIALLAIAPVCGLRAEVQSIAAISMTVSDIDRSVDFYSHALAFTKISDQTLADHNYDRLVGVFDARARIVRLQLGDDVIELVQYIGPRGQPIPLDSKSNDLWFQHLAIVVRDMDQAFAALQKVSFQATTSEPQTIPLENKVAAGVRAFKFKDPDGHNLELLFFPAGKGRARWHKPTERLFLGIDHSAITVFDTDRSIDFYTRVMGMQVLGSNLNTGLTQERLDNAFNAKVRVTALRPASSDGPGIEFLQYLTPPGGRPIPPGLASNDLTHMHIELVVQDVQSEVAKLEQAKAQFVSPEVIAVKGRPFQRGTIVRDPDGHALLLINR